MGKTFGVRFGSVSHVCTSCYVFEPSLTSPPGHYRLWENGIHHGDISLNNLMYDVCAETGDPVGIVNDFDLATWVDHPTTNNDRTGTIPFMAIDLLDGGLDRRIPRLYRHDLESFIWVLTYITVTYKEYTGHNIKLSSPGVGAWFKDRDEADRKTHVMSKRLFHLEHGNEQLVFRSHLNYAGAVKQMTRYWADFYRMKHTLRFDSPIMMARVQKPITNKPELDPRSTVREFIATVEELLGEHIPGDGFAEVKTLLLKAIETPIVNVEA